VNVAELRGVTKRFGAVTALEGVDLDVPQGEVVALLGPNGAGKSTAIAVLLGLRVPDAGAARLHGLDPRAPRARRDVGVVPQELGFPPTLRVRELLELVRRHYPAPGPPERLAARLGLGPVLHRQAGGLSGGWRRLVAVALAFAGAPSLLVLDEPTAALDADARRAVWDAIRGHAARGGTVLLTTHHLDEAEALATRVTVLDRGRVAANGGVAAIKASAGLTRVSFRAPAGLELEGAEREGERLRLAVADAGVLVAELVRRGVRLDGLEVRPLTLEEALAVRGSRA